MKRPRRPRLLIYLPLLVVGLFYVASRHSTISRTPGETLHLAPDRLAALTVKANRGDATAAKRISDYYLYYQKNYSAGFQWLERAALLGDEKSRDLLQSNFKAWGLADYRRILHRTNEPAEAALQKLLSPTNR